MSLVPKHGKEVKMTANDMTYKIELLKNQIQQMKKADARRSVSFSDLCMFSDFECPHEFRMPKFEKYKGVGCPWTHLHSYGIAMSQYANNEKLLIQTFLNSLTGPAAIWFIQLEKTKINSWEDLANAFITQYKFNIEVPPDRFDLQKESILSGESFHEYAQRWRAKAAQVKPPLSEKELISTFLSTLASPFYEHLVGTATNDFATFIQADGSKPGKSSIIADSISQSSRILQKGMS